MAWSAATGSSATSSPAVVNGVAYVGSADGKLDAFDAAGVDRLLGRAEAVYAVVDRDHRRRGLVAGGRERRRLRRLR